ncbi:MULTISPECIES: ABC transporter ATP-binding protein [Brachybacterium]|uniref:ABC transporter ATP-binding protein n=1 Tax=Brachybacterium TaxID=43668 RepID=UPI000DF3E3A4|nr:MULTISPECIES: ABC transporter ATP-binding protein [Brachybacterium]RCS62431.1 ABC transporter ATP-binding protein [Brachybacterium alimentarium]RCS64130.1 ABC transporter ATP-binding protein [Brachybacterium alimentarium]RCS65533.1 ABC transporter ATP-binding protein [Brachybacterium sp. JB7]RCS75512.1 ABC transporter ATP-binding protein [Brachybacterium alimentarium]RCS79251.1 ABC transporter ATP-binding protein [Brachybacterium alimentarium]
MPDISLHNVVKNYGGETNAVESLDLQIDDGDFMCLLGPSGCGKTTTVRMIAGLETVTEGRLSIGDRVVDEPRASRFVSPEKRNIGLVFQSYALWPHMSVADNIAYGLKIQKMSSAERVKRVDELTATMGIEQYRDRFPSQLSGGQQQRVALARMLAVNPDLMLLDEPLSNLDSRLRLEMRAELKRIHAEYGATVIFVTHDQWEAMTLATRVAVMNEGVLQQVGSPMDIYDRPVNRFVANFLGVPPMNFIETTEQTPQATAVREHLGRQIEDPSRLGSVGIRPESFAVGIPGRQHPAERLVLTGRIESVMPTGGSWTIEASVGSQRIYATTLQRGSLLAGGDIDLLLGSEQIHAFDLHEQRIEVGE